MNILVIGGSGFIGSYLVKQLVKERHKITVISRGKSVNNLESHKNLEFITGDRNDVHFMERLAWSGFDVVYDLAAFKEYESELAVRLFRNRVKRFIHLSTVSVYMVSNQIQCPISEGQDKGEIMEFWPMNPFGMQYGIDKRKCEKVLWQAYKKFNFPLTVVRPPYVCGPKDPMKRDFFWIERIMDGNPLLIPGAGDFATQLVYVEDLAEILANLIKSDLSLGKVYNVASEEIFSLNDYLDNLCELLDLNPKRISVDIDVFLKQPFSVSSEGHAFPFNTYRTAVFSLDKLKKDGLMISTPFCEWMPRTIEWYLNECVGHSVGYSKRDEEIKFIKKYLSAKKTFNSSVL